MTDKILVVTQPDDSLLQGIRITHVNLSEEQSNIISGALLQTEIPDNIINYVWKMGERVDWLLDKIAKSDIVIFNAEGKLDPGREIIIGWTAAQPHSYYFGTLRDLHLANDHVIYGSNDILNLINKASKKSTINNVLSNF